MSLGYKFKFKLYSVFYHGAKNEHNIDKGGSGILFEGSNAGGATFVAEGRDSNMQKRAAEKPMPRNHSS